MPIDRLLYRYKGDCCAYCGMTLDEMVKKHGTFRRVFQFNHMDPSKKAKDYDKLIQRKLSSEQLDEVDKCVLLCVICHGVLHAQNHTVEAVVTLSTEGFEVKHPLKFQVIEDHEQQKGMLFSDDLEFLVLYRVRLGGRAPQIYSGLQLKDSDILHDMILRTKEERTLLVETLDGEPMLRVNKVSDDRYELIPNLYFPLIKADLSFGDHLGNQLGFHFRKGQMIIDTGGSPILRRSFGDIQVKYGYRYGEKPELIV